ncbi:sugar phosphate isomerase/epimerase family protein [Actinacidiphila sp. bgisy144]|uniref:sugar phosphate isomerase/epimerase family protein n=1 Tax=Actinacidiphila sp. bgisy144 TaxID=3413791 RepID=UPI003EBE0502
MSTEPVRPGSVPRPGPPVDMSTATSTAGSAAMSGGVALTGIGDEAALGIEGQIEAVTALGWRSVELRTVDGTPLADLSAAAFDRVAGALVDAGLSVVAVDARIGGWARPVTGDFAADLAELDVLARRCARLGTRYVRVMSYPNPADPSDGGLDAAAWEREVLCRVRELSARAAASGLTLLHENCAGWAGSDPHRMVRLLEEAGPGLALLFDTGNGPAYGYDGHRLLTDLLPYADRIHHVHIKDAVLSPGGAVRHCVPGTGDLRVADSVRLLLAHGYRGALSLEPHVAVRPHEDHRDPAEECRAAFVRCGLALRRLLDEALAPPTAAVARDLERQESAR